MQLNTADVASLKLGERIRYYRIQKGLNKASLGRIVGVSDVSVSYWESGQISEVGHRKLCRLCQALGVSLDTLLADEMMALSNEGLSQEDQETRRCVSRVLSKVQDRHENSEPLYLEPDDLGLLVKHTPLQYVVTPA